MAGEGSLQDIKARLELLESALVLTDGDKGDIIIDDDQMLLDDIDLGTFN